MFEDLKLVKGHVEKPKPLNAREEKHCSHVKIKRSIAYDENGDVVYDVAKKPNWQNGSGFVMMYSEKCNDFLKKVTSCSTVRVFFFLANNQCYGDKGIFGFRCSKKHLGEMLGIDMKSMYNALKWLKENFMVHVGRYNGQLEFMVSPHYVTLGTDKKKRVAEWDRRWKETLKAQALKKLPVLDSSDAE